MLFSKTNNNFNTISSSAYSNLKIILGNGLDMVNDFSQQIILASYIFSVTLVIGIIFTSTITALITDSLLEKNTEKEFNHEASSIWFKRAPSESIIEYYLRASFTIAFI